MTMSLLDVSDPSLARLPVRDNIKRRIRALRQNNQVAKERNNLQFDSVLTKLTMNQRKEIFLRCDTGPGKWTLEEKYDLQLVFLGDERILIFASPEQLQILQTSNDFLVDGMFKVVPEVFYQLYIVHAVYRQHVVSVIYALLKRKNDETYQRMLEEIIKVAPDWSPTTVMMDFEQASINAFQCLFPSVALSGCYFHLRRSIHRKIQVGKKFRW